MRHPGYGLIQTRGGQEGALERNTSFPLLAVLSAQSWKSAASSGLSPGPGFPSGVAVSGEKGSFLYSAQAPGGVDRTGLGGNLVSGPISASTVLCNLDPPLPRPGFSHPDERQGPPQF